MRDQKKSLKSRRRSAGRVMRFSSTENLDRVREEFVFARFHARFTASHEEVLEEFLLRSDVR